MKRLLSIELQKIWRNKASRVLTISYFVILSFIALIASINFKIGSLEVRIADQGIFNFPYIWHFNTYIASILKFFLAIVIVSMMANEYTYGTLKQNLIDGLSKKEFVLSKFLTILIFAASSAVFVFIISLILGLFFSSYTEIGIIFSELEYILAYFVKLLGFFSFCLFLGVLVKRSAFALGFLLLWWILEAILSGIIAFQIFPTGNTASYITMFFPLEAMSDLIVEPFTRLSFVKTIGTQIGVTEIKDYGVRWYGILIVLAWTYIFTLLSFKLLQKRDL